MIVLTSLESVLPPIHRSGSRCGFCFSSSTIRTFSLPPSSPSIVKEQVLCCKTRCSSCLLSSSKFSLLNHKPSAVEGQALGLAEEDDNDDEEFQVLTALRSHYNDIVILDTPKSRMLLLDPSHNVHSIFNKGQKWTGSYWDEFASLPAIVPKGPIAILGLGGGTAAHLMLELWPSLQLDGWEIDEILIDKARDYLGLSDLEKHTQAGGILRVHVGDALSPSVNVPGGYAGIVIDLFSDGRVLTQLQEVATWLELNDKLMPNGRLMVNCGAANDGASSGTDTVTHPKISSVDDTWVKNSTIKALCEVFPGNLNWKKMPKKVGENYLALTGPLPDLTTWSAVLPDQLSSAVKQWRPCCLS